MMMFDDTLVFTNTNESGPTAGKELQLHFGPQPGGNDGGTQSEIDLDFTGLSLGQAAALLLPAVQAAREAALRDGGDDHSGQTIINVARYDGAYIIQSATHTYEIHDPSSFHELQLVMEGIISGGSTSFDWLL